MDVSGKELTERFQNLSDGEVSRLLRSGTLTPLATEVASAVLRSRGFKELPSPEVAGSLEESTGGWDDDEVDLVTVAELWNPLEAQVLRGLLESHGVFAHVWGEHMGTANMFLSIAGGGSRVQVRSDQVTLAKELISSFERSEIKTPDSARRPSDPPADAGVRSRSALAGRISLVLVGLLIALTLWFTLAH